MNHLLFGQYTGYILVTYTLFIGALAFNVWYIQRSRKQIFRQLRHYFMHQRRKAQ